MLIGLLFVSVCFLAFANGANDNFKGVASLFGSGILNYRLALAWATATTLAGSVAALFLAQTLLIKFSGKGLAPDELIHSLAFMVAVAGGAGLTVILATRLGFPISTTHSLLGAMAGSTLVATGPSFNLAPLLDNFVLPLLLSPVAAIFLAGLLYWLGRRYIPAQTTTNAFCVCVDNAGDEDFAEIASQDTAIAESMTATTINLDSAEACEQHQHKVLLDFNLSHLADSLHVFSAGAVCFARGLNDTPKIAALLLMVPSMSQQNGMLTVALVMMTGGLLNARRVAETMSHKITRISHGQGLAANLVTAGLVIFASKLGMPVSTTHVSVGSLFGIGWVNHNANKNVVASIALSWLLTLPCAAACAAGIYYFAAN